MFNFYVEQAIFPLGAYLWGMNYQVIIVICYKVSKHPLHKETLCVFSIPCDQCMLKELTVHVPSQGRHTCAFSMPAHMQKLQDYFWRVKRTF